MHVTTADISLTYSKKAIATIYLVNRFKINKVYLTKTQLIPEQHTFQTILA
jgi:hypothetical protein